MIYFLKSTFRMRSIIVSVLFFRCDEFYEILIWIFFCQLLHAYLVFMGVKQTFMKDCLFSIFSGVSYIRTPEIQIFQLTDDFYLETDLFIRYFVPYVRNFAFRIRTVGLFYNKTRLTINFASFNRTLKFNGTTIHTIERLRLSTEFPTYSHASPHELLILTSQITFKYYQHCELDRISLT